VIRQRTTPLVSLGSLPRQTSVVSLMSDSNRGGRWSGWQWFLRIRWVLVHRPPPLRVCWCLIQAVPNYCLKRPWRVVSEPACFPLFGPVCPSSISLCGQQHNVLYLKRFLFKFLSSCLLSCRFFHFIFFILYLAVYMQIKSGCKRILYSGSKKHEKLKPALETDQKTCRRKKWQKMGETRKIFS